jgi:hypothetical protein
MPDCDGPMIGRIFLPILNPLKSSSIPQTLSVLKGKDGFLRQMPMLFNNH